MMATTHALVGAMLAAVTLFLAPEYTPVAVTAGLLGGVFPDFDLYWGHRQTLHYPVYFSIASFGAAIGALVYPSVWTIALAFFLLAAAAHSVMDIFGGGLELKPWQGISDRAVYDHFRGEWLPPRRWIRYDGAPEDMLLAGAMGLPALWLYDGVLEQVVLVALAVSLAYALVRKPIVYLAERLIPRVPTRYLERVPERFIRDFSR
ncbi:MULTISPECIES: metal-dependent hydrolase [unclassified Haladaptatus]|uniref:metal-dependent hydrolase n=1 Tax=unclassified Haladaptatus TaxID=2622732 RepID=UPI0023E8174A|nr:MULTISPECIES: metal-dependent hydrolase [unclassified Haladaptatus]